MFSHIKTHHGIALLLASFLLAITLINQSNQRFSLIVSNTIDTLQFISTRNQLASVLDGADSGLVGWWKFDDIANDSVGSNNGTISGGVTYVDGKIGRAVSFDGVDSCVVVGKPLSLVNLTNGLSVSAWIKTNTSALQRQIAGDSYPNSGGAWFGYTLEDYANNYYRFYVENSANPTSGGMVYVQNTAGSVPPNKWTHLVGTYDGAGNLRMYVNGILNNSTASSTVSTINASTRRFMIGASDNGTACTGFYNGSIDDVRVYNRALSATEIEEFYNQTQINEAISPITPSSPETNASVTPPVTLSINSIQPPVASLVNTNTLPQILPIQNWQYNWNTRTDRYGKPAGIFDQTPFPINENSISYSIANDENPNGKTFYLGTKYYVDGGYMGGSNDGSWQKPWTSITTAIAHLPGGAGNNTIIVRGAHDSFNGIYYETGINNVSTGHLAPRGGVTGVDDTHRFMIVGYGQERPIIDGNNSAIDIIGSPKQAYSYVTIQRLRLQNNKRSGVRFVNAGYNNLIDVEVKNIGLTYPPETGGDGPLIYYLASSNGWIFHVTATHTLGHCIKVGDTSSNMIEEWTVAAECGYWPNISVEASSPADAATTCLDFPNDGGSVATSIISRYNIAHDCLVYGVQIRNISGFSLHHNEIYNSPNITASNQVLSGTNQKLTCYNFYSPCAQVLALGLEPSSAWSYTPLDKIRIYSNVIRDNNEPGYGVGIGIANMTNGHTVQIYNNILYNNPYSEIALGGGYYPSRLVEIYNNILWHSNGVGAHYGAGTIAVPNEVVNHWDANEVIVKNNIMANLASGSKVFGENRGVHNTTNDYNLYYYPNGSLGTTAGANDYAHGASTNPLLATPLSGAYSWGMGTLSSNSPAIDAGLNLSNLFTADFNFTPRPQGSAWDIGAYEYVGSGGVVTPPVIPPIVPSTPTIGDFNNDGIVNSIDLSLMITAWNMNNATYDLNRDGAVNSLDYVVMVRNWTM